VVAGAGTEGANPDGADAEGADAEGAGDVSSADALTDVGRGDGRSDVTHAETSARTLASKIADRGDIRNAHIGNRTGHRGTPKSSEENLHRASRA
jgi:hypothetical protein